MKIAFHTALELSHAIDALFVDFPVIMYYKLDSIAPYPDFQSHDGVEMYYIWEGMGNYLVGDQVYPLQPGTLMLIRPRTLHKVVQIHPDHNVCRHVLIWKEHFITSSLRSNEKNPFLEKKIDCWYVQPNVEERNRIENIYEVINKELTHQEEGFEAIVHSLVKEVLFLCARIHTKSNVQNRLIENKHFPKEISFLFQYINSNFQENLNLKSLAKLVHMNHTYLTSLFQKTTGYSLGKFIVIKRIHHAKNLLRETEKSISLIASECGFSDTSYFIKVFKKFEKRTPFAFRKKQH
jgi:AraC family transcriptional regulator